MNMLDRMRWTVADAIERYRPPGRVTRLRRDVEVGRLAVRKAVLARAADASCELAAFVEVLHDILHDEWIVTGREHEGAQGIAYTPEGWFLPADGSGPHLTDEPCNCPERVEEG
jgi:hypothetical protein